jgi:hypothetical protein
MCCEREHEAQLQIEASLERERSRQMANATLVLSEQLKNRDYRFEDSDAYKLAIKLSQK